MADVNRGKRPLSPHLEVYRFGINMLTSILHRITGVALMGGMALIVWWLGAAAGSEGYYETINGLWQSWFGKLVLAGVLLALWYHFCTGIRHLIYDTGRGYSLCAIDRSGYLVIGASLVLTVISLIVLC